MCEKNIVNTSIDDIKDDLNYTNREKIDQKFYCLLFDFSMYRQAFLQ